MAWHGYERDQLSSRCRLFKSSVRVRCTEVQPKLDRARYGRSASGSEGSARCVCTRSQFMMATAERFLDYKSLIRTSFYYFYTDFVSIWMVAAAVQIVDFNSKRISCTTWLFSSPSTALHTAPYALQYKSCTYKSTRFGVSNPPPLSWLSCTRVIC